MYKKEFLNFVALLPLFFAFSVTSQVNQEKFETAGDIYETAGNYFSDEEYEKAYEEFSKINYNDTSYFESRQFALQCASKMNKYDTVINIAKDILEMDKYNPYRESFMNSLGHGLIQLDKFNEAQSFLLESLKEYPRNYLLYFNLASTYAEQEKYDLAVEALQNSIRYNPKYYASHSRLAMICAEAGYYTKAALALNMAIFLDAGNERSLYLINSLEDVYNGEIESEIDEVNFREEEEFDEIDLMLKNKLAENSKYKVKVKIGYNFIKHNHLLFEKIEYDESSNGFWNQNYIHFFKNVFDTKNFANFSYYQCLQVENSKAQAIIKKNEKKLIVFIKWAYDDYTTKMNARNVWDGSDYVENTLVHYGSYGFNEDYLVDDGVRSGDYYSYSGEGILESRGQFSNDGELDGLWTYYDEFGNMDVTQTFDEGELAGTRTTYYKNGSRRKEFDILNNAIDGDITIYYAINKVYNRIPYDKEGNKEGEAKYYHENGQLSHVINYSANEFDGEFNEYYYNGQLKFKKTFEEGVPVGDYVDYYMNGEIKSVGQFKGGMNDGHWKMTHDNGELEEEGEYREGYRIGIWKEYRSDGSLKNEADYGETGKKTGVYKEYDKDGDLQLELTYKGSEIVKYKTFNKAGEVVNEQEKKKKKLEFVDYYRNGEKRVVGEYYKGEAVGVWKYYNEHGILTAEKKYNDDGNLEGKSKWYFDNGVLETVKSFKDGVADGYFVDYYRSGKIYKHGWLVDGDLAGLWEYFYRDGSLRKDEYYLEGEVHGDVRFFDEKGNLDEVRNYFYGTFSRVRTYDSTGVIVSECVLVDGDASCDYKDPQGKIQTSTNYVGGFVSGTQTGHFANGQVKSKGENTFGNQIGDWVWYHRNGQVATEGSYVLGQRDGEWKWYYDSGELQSVSTYLKGEKVGVSISYYENGKKETEKTFKEGERHGKSIYYDESGIVQYYRFHNYGLLIGYSYLGRDNKPVEMIEFNGKDGVMEAFFPSGKKSYYSKYENGFNDGTTIYYHSNGQISESRPYKANQYDGKMTEYYSNGKPKYEAVFSQGDLVGEEKTYYSNGKLKSVIQYVLDDKYGWAEYFDKTGKSLEKVLYYDNRQMN